MAIGTTGKVYDVGKALVAYNADTKKLKVVAKKRGDNSTIYIGINGQNIRVKLSGGNQDISVANQTNPTPQSPDQAPITYRQGKLIKLNGEFLEMQGCSYSTQQMRLGATQFSDYARQVIPSFDYREMILDSDGKLYLGKRIGFTGECGGLSNKEKEELDMSRFPTDLLTLNPSTMQSEPAKIVEIAVSRIGYYFRYNNGYAYQMPKFSQLLLIGTNIAGFKRNDCISYNKNDGKVETITFNPSDLEYNFLEISETDYQEWYKKANIYDLNNGYANNRIKKKLCWGGTGNLGEVVGVGLEAIKPCLRLNW